MFFFSFFFNPSESLSGVNFAVGDSSSGLVELLSDCSDDTVCRVTRHHTRFSWCEFENLAVYRVTRHQNPVSCCECIFFSRCTRLHGIRRGSLAMNVKIYCVQVWLPDIRKRCSCCESEVWRCTALHCIVLVTVAVSRCESLSCTALHRINTLLLWCTQMFTFSVNLILLSWLAHQICVVLMLPTPSIIL